MTHHNSNAANGAMLVARATVIETTSGRLIDLMAPDAAAIDPHDIAHALAMTCRYGGQIKRFYSVAEHVLLVRDLMAHQGATGDLLRAALLHDAAEAYLGDVVAPLKYALRQAEYESRGHLMGDIAIDAGLELEVGHEPDKYALVDDEGERHVLSALEHFAGAYAWLTERIERAIGERFDIDPELFDHEAVKLADLWAVRIEAAELTRSGGANWRWRGALPCQGKLPEGISWAGGLAPDVRLAATLATQLGGDSDGR